MKKSIIASIFILIIINVVGILFFRQAPLLKIKNNFLNNPVLNRLKLDYDIDAVAKHQCLKVYLKGNNGKTYRFPYHDKSITVTVKDEIDQLVYMAILDSTFILRGYKTGESLYLESASDVLLKKVGIERTINEKGTHYLIKLSKEYRLIEEKPYITKDIIVDQTDSLQKNESFALVQGEIVLVKSYDLYENVDRFYIFEEEITENSYDSVKTILEFLLDANEYEKFFQNYLELQDYDSDRFIIDVDYIVTSEEISGPSGKITKITFKR